MTKEFTITLTEKELDNLLSLIVMKAAELENSNDMEKSAEYKELFKKLWEMKNN